MNRPKLTIIEGGKSDNKPEPLLNPKSFGGTEILARRVFKELPELCEKYQWILSYPQKTFDPNKKKILWMHETPFDKAIQQNFQSQNYWQQFDKIVFVTYWQQQLFHFFYNVPYEKGLVIQNAIDPFLNIEKDRPGKFKLIYASTPHRGLNILLSTLENLERDDWELDIFSSFKIYDRASQDLQFQSLFNKAEEMKNVNYHGFVDNETVRKYMSEAHILTYPCTYMETSCITAIEAMSAGCAVICPNFGALPETTANFSWNYNYESDNNRHSHVFGHVLTGLMDNYNNPNVVQLLNMAKVYTDTFYNWKIRIQLWKQLLTSLDGDKINNENSNDNTGPEIA